MHEQMQEWKDGAGLPGGRHLVLDKAGLSIWFQRLEPGEETPWHWHEHVTDTFTVVTGAVVLKRRDREAIKLARSESDSVPSGAWHQLANIERDPATVVTVQTGGKRDFNTE